MIMQKNAMQCGVACLSMIIRYYGHIVGMDYLDSLCGVTAEGVSLRAIAEAAHQLGFDTKASFLDMECLSKAPLPMILHWNQNHFVVLYKVSKNGKHFYIADPAKGKRKLSASEFREYWVGSNSVKSYKGIGMYITPKDSVSDTCKPYKKREGDEALVALSLISRYAKNIKNIFYRYSLVSFWDACSSLCCRF